MTAEWYVVRQAKQKRFLRRAKWLTPEIISSHNSHVEAALEAGRLCMTAYRLGMPVRYWTINDAEKRELDGAK